MQREKMVGLIREVTFSWTVRVIGIWIFWVEAVA